MKNPQHRKYMILLLLILVFACPGLAALAFYQHPQWLSSASVNKGQLLTPPEHIAGIKAKAKWRLILWTSAACDTACQQQLDKLARIRLALGRRLYEVDEWLLNSQPLPDTLQQTLKDQDIHHLLLSSADADNYHALTGSARIFIANPDNYLILAYPTDDKPDNIFRDLKRLLNSNDNKRG